MAGEVSNAAIYFTTFADVSKHLDDHMNPSKAFGRDWKPLSYEKKYKMALRLQTAFDLST